MNRRAFVPALISSLAITGCARPTPEQQFVNDVVDALGGRNRIQAVKTLTIEGEGTNYNLGQDMKPDASTQQFAVTEYKRQIDVANRRQRVEQTRTPKFAFFQGPQPQKQVQGLDDQVAYNVNPAGAAARIATRAEIDRRADLYHHPVVLVRAVLDAKATVSNVRQVGTVRQGDVTIAGGPTVTMSLDAAGLPLSISSKSYHANLGDVVMTTTFGEYQLERGVKLPAQFTGKVDDFTTWQIHAKRQAADEEAGDLAAPVSVRAPATAPAAPNVTAESMGKGVWLLGGQSHHSALVEFDNHLMLIDAPQSEARTLAVIAKARQTVPGKPLQQLVTTHHHFDHTAGLRAAIAEGLTVITHSGNRAWVEAMARRPHTIQPDALAKQEQRLVVETVDAEREYKDQNMTVMLYHVEGNPHSDTMLMAYIPSARVVVQVDAFGMGSAVNPYAANLLENIQKRKLRVDHIVPLHGGPALLSDLEKVARP